MRYHRLATLTALLTFVLMVLGSIVHGTGSSLACPDWPLCHGTVFPRMTGGVEFEHTHRLVALSVASLVAALAYRARRLADVRTRRAAYAALGLVAVQASLGALTVVLRLPPVVSIAHLATSLLVLTTLASLALWSSGARAAAGRAPRTWAAVAAGAAWGQAIVGAVVRHSGAALACATVPSCDGVFWPEGLLPRIQMAHRAGGVVVAILAVVAARTARARERDARVRAIALAPPLLVILQIALGIGVVVEGAPLALTTLHHATGALLVASLGVLWASLQGPGASFSRRTRSPAFLPGTELQVPSRSRTARRSNPRRSPRR